MHLKLDVPKEAVVDLGYRGVDQDNLGMKIVHRGWIKRMTAQVRQQLKRRQAVEPVIGHLKADHRMKRCWLKGAEGDVLNAVLAASTRISAVTTVIKMNPRWKLPNTACAT